jgi:mevalonate kinase
MVMKKVTVSAPGKLHLSGEHAVVFGKPAILVSTSLRLYVTLDEAGDGEPLSQVRTHDPFINVILETFEKKYTKQLSPDVKIHISSSIPKGAGMGSSAALAVSLIGALFTWFDIGWDAQRINELAYQAEKHVHKNPSGGDPAIVTHGGLLWFRKELEYLKTFWLLPFHIPKSFATFVLIHTGRSESTGDLVEVVAKLREKNLDASVLLLDRIEQVTRRMTQAIHDEKEDAFYKEVKENESLLEEIGVVSETSKAFIRAIEKQGGVAKISGAGGIKTGSGIIIAAGLPISELEDLAKKHGHTSFTVTLGGEGVKKEQVVV